MDREAPGFLPLHRRLSAVFSLLPEIPAHIRYFEEPFSPFPASPPKDAEGHADFFPLLSALLGVF